MDAHIIFKWWLSGSEKKQATLTASENINHVSLEDQVVLNSLGT